MSVKWQWKGDKGYVDYDADMVRKLEKAVVDDKDEVKVDSDRFVDVHNKLQRRYDDRSKRRKVRRVLPPLFGQDIFYLLTPTKKDREKLEDEIDKHYGLVSPTINKSVSFVIVRDEKTLVKNAKVLKEADPKNLKTPVLSSKFIFQSAESIERLDPFKFRLDDYTPPPSPKQQSSTNVSTSSANQNDDSMQTDDNDKSKDDINNTTTTPNPTTLNPTTLNPSRQFKENLAPITLPDSFVSLVSPGNKYKGNNTNPSGTDLPFPLTLSISTFTSPYITGTISWSTLSSVSSFKAWLSISPANTELHITLLEDSVISGEDIEPGSWYDIVLDTDGRIRGTVQSATGEQSGFVDGKKVNYEGKMKLDETIEIRLEMGAEEGKVKYAGQEEEKLIKVKWGDVKQDPKPGRTVDMEGELTGWLWSGTVSKEKDTTILKGHIDFGMGLFAKFECSL